MIAIKGMEMPSCCGECNLTACKGKDEPWNYCCSITLKDINFDDTERPSDCPLVEIEERKVGKWVKKYQYGNDYCSECNYENCGYGYPKFCPNCGAEMRGSN